MQAQMLYNNWFGKAVGATCAWIWAPNDAIWLAVAIIVGIALGHLYDLWAANMHDTEAANLAQFARTSDEAPPYAAFLFAALGRIAKAGGRVSPEHIAYADGLMRQMGLDAQGKEAAKRWFRQGKSADLSMQDLSRRCLVADNQGSASRLTILRCLCATAAITPNDQAVNTLKSLGGLLGFAPSRIAGEYGAYHQPEGTPERPAINPELDAAYRCLDLTPGASLTAALSATRLGANAGQTSTVSCCSSGERTTGPWSRSRRGSWAEPSAIPAPSKATTDQVAGETVEKRRLGPPAPAAGTNSWSAAPRPPK